jgi:Flp pilus assembly protein TadD
MTPKLQKIVDNGLDAMRAHDCDLAGKQFQKGVEMAPGSAELAFLLGTAEFCLQHTNLVRKNFERAVNLDPSHERALLSLGEMQLAAKETSSAIATLEKAQSVNASDWSVHMALANAYWRVGHRLNDAEAQATLAVQQTNDKNCSARLLLGEIQYAQGNARRPGRRGKS